MSRHSLLGVFTRGGNEHCSVFVFGVRCPEHLNVCSGIWYLVTGAWYPVRYQVPVIRYLNICSKGLNACSGYLNTCSCSVNTVRCQPWYLLSLELVEAAFPWQRGLCFRVLQYYWWTVSWGHWCVWIPCAAHRAPGFPPPLLYLITFFHPHLYSFILI
jgi:hypothetical protein